MRCPKCQSNIPLIKISGHIECPTCGARLVASDKLALVIVLVLWFMVTPVIAIIASAVSGDGNRFFLPIFIVADMIAGFGIFYLIYKKTDILNIREEKEREPE